MEADKERTHARAVFLLGMLGMDGIGNAAAARLFASFDSFDDIRRYPDEQVAARLKRIPSALNIARSLHDKDVTAEAEKLGVKLLDTLNSKKIEVLTPDSGLWPQGLAHLSPSARPPYLCVYGNQGLLREPVIGINASSEISGDKSLAVISEIVDKGSGPFVLTEYTAAANLHLFGDRELVVILSTGFAGIDDFRDRANTIVKNHGLLISPFDIDHRTFRHEISTLDSIANALADVSVFVSVDKSEPLFDLMLKLTGEQKPLFAVNVAESLPDGIHPVKSPEDVFWIQAATGIDEDGGAT